MEENNINNNSNSKEVGNENNDIEKDNTYRLSNIIKGNSYIEEINKQKEISFFNEPEDIKSDEDTTNSHIIDEINSSMINFKEMNSVCKDMSLILYESNFIYNFKEEEFKIQYGNNIIKEYKELIALVEKYKKKIFKLFDDFFRLVQFLEKVREEIKKGFINELELEIKLKLYTKKESNDNGIIKNIEYNIKYSYKNKLISDSSFNDNNILNNLEPIGLKTFISDEFDNMKIRKIELEYDEMRKENIIQICSLLL